MAIKIGLAGNPNCGKTTMFNALTGATQYVGNWPGVTVEKKSGKLKGNKNVEIVDLPGVYSLSPYTLEEVVTRRFMLEDHPDVIINIVDATNIERNLYLTTQILELGIPTVIALNMMDLVQKNGDKIHTKQLAKKLGCPVVELSALKGKGTQEVAEEAIRLAEQKQKTSFELPLMEGIFERIMEIESVIKAQIGNQAYPKRYVAIKIFERDQNMLETLKLSATVLDEVERITALCEKQLEDDSESIITGERYAYIGDVVGETVKKAQVGKDTVSDQIDKIVTNRFLAIPVFALIMWSVYYIAVSSLGTVLTDWTNDTLFGEMIQGNVSVWMEQAGTAQWLQSLVVDGLIGGVGAVLGFVPQIMLLFLLLSILEDCGYMARVAFIMDRVFRKFGLSGKSFIPMLISSGCGVPGIMATRTMENDRDRKMTIMLTTFIPCSAKLPIIALFSSALFNGASWVAPSVYFLGVGMIILCGIILKQTKLFIGDPAPFVMELPQYHIPSFKGVLLHMWERGKSFIVKAGTVIFVACGLIWLTQTFNWSLQMVDADKSILASIGNIFAPVFKPLGFGNWQAATAAITGLVAKENVVATYGILFGVQEATESDPTLLQSMALSFNGASAYAFMIFNMLCAPCFAAIGAIRKEMGSWKWTMITVSFQTFVAYIVGLVIYQVGTALFYGGSLLQAGIAILLAVVVCVVVLYLLRPQSEKELKTMQSM